MEEAKFNLAKDKTKTLARTTSEKISDSFIEKFCRAIFCMRGLILKMYS